MDTMAAQSNPELRYAPRYCMVFQKSAWAIRTKQADGHWRIVNCLDKDEACYHAPCAFTMLGGAWPFSDAVEEVPQPSCGRHA